jgi:hypothetical protein
MQKVIGFGAGLALAALLTTVANASVVYNWVNTPGPGVDPPAASGILTLTDGIVSDLTFTLYGITPPDNTFTGTAVVLPDQNLTLSGTTTGSGVDSGAIAVTWTPTVFTALLGENSAYYEDVTSFTIFGDWVPETAVPEATTIIAGGLMLLPFGASALRMLRKRQTA